MQHTNEGIREVKKLWTLYNYVCTILIIYNVGFIINLRGLVKMVFIL